MWVDGWVGGWVGGTYLVECVFKREGEVKTWVGGWVGRTLLNAYSNAKARCRPIEVAETPAFLSWCMSIFPVEEGGWVGEWVGARKIEENEAVRMSCCGLGMGGWGGMGGWVSGWVGGWVGGALTWHFNGDELFLATAACGDGWVGGWVGGGGGGG